MMSLLASCRLPLAQLEVIGQVCAGQSPPPPPKKVAILLTCAKADIVWTQFGLKKKKKKYYVQNTVKQNKNKKMYQVCKIRSTVPQTPQKAKSPVRENLL